MIEDRERAVAYVAIRLATKSISGLIRDDATAAYVLMSGKVSADLVHVYDFQTRGYISGTGSSDRLTLFHARDNASVDLIATGSGSFAGYDHASGQRFTVSVEGKTVSVTGMVPGRSRKYSI